MNKLSGIGALVVSIVAILVALLTGGTHTITEKIKEVGSVTNFDQVASGDALEFHKRLALNSGEQFATWRNTTGAPVFLDLQGSILNKYVTTATSSSFVLFMGTSSASTLTGGSGLSVVDGGGIYASGTHKGTDDGLVIKNLPYSSILDNLRFATDTMREAFGSTTSLADHIAYGQINVQRNENARDASSTVVMIEPQDYVWMLLVTGEVEQIDKAGSACGDSVAGEGDNNCESATSTGRGGNFEAILHFTATSTINN